VLEKLEKLSDVSEEAYHKVIDQVAKKYQEVKSIDKKDVMEFVDELKSHWKHILKEVTMHAKKKGGKK
jgi:hypothetical protein